MNEPGYPNPGRCEGTRVNPRYTGATFSPTRLVRCEREATVWHEQSFRWLCSVHASRQRKAS